MEQNKIQVFNNTEFGNIRSMEIGGEPWFVGKDVATALGYANASKAISVHVDTEDKQFFMLDIADSQNGNVPIGKTKTAIVNESGLYSLILGSKLDGARRLRLCVLHWKSGVMLCHYRGLSEWGNEKGWLTDTCLDGQDTFIRLMDMLEIQY